MDTRARNTLLGEAIGHAMYDTWFGVAPVLLASVSTSLALSNADIGLIILLYQAVSSVMQPIFGRLSERFGGRVFAVGAILWTTVMFTGTLFAMSKVAFGALVALAGLGSGAFHPQGTANSTVAGGARYGATATAIFFFGGTLGTAFFGSALGGFLIDRFGRQSLVALSAMTVIVALTVVRRLIPKELSLAKPDAAGESESRAVGKGVWMIIALLLIGIAFRSVAQQSLTIYIPKYQQDLGVVPSVYGLVLSLFLAANATGGVLGSLLGDRIGFRFVLVGSLLLSALTMFLSMRVTGLAGYANLVLAGLFLGPSHTLFIVSGQRRFPQRMAMVSGLFLGFTFVSGAVGAWLLGLIADHVGLGTMLAFLPIPLVLGGLCALVAVPRNVSEATPALQEPVAMSEG